MSTDSNAMLARRHLLGELSPTEADDLDLAMLRDPAVVDEVAEAEEQLIEDFLEERCTPATLRRFEQHYLASPVHARRVAVIRGLRARTRSARRPTWTQGFRALAAVIVIGVFVAGWFVATRGPEPLVLSIPAVAVRSEGATTPTVQLGDKPAPIELRLESLEAGSGALAAAVETVEGEALWRGTARVAGSDDATEYVVLLPSGTLGPGDFILDVAGQRAYFRVAAP